MDNSLNNRGCLNNTTRRRLKTRKDLEKEVEMFLSQYESSDENNIDSEELPADEVRSSSTKNKQIKGADTSRSELVLLDVLQTPRRSCRKSVKPPQDYDDIVRKSTRSISRSLKKDLIALSEENEENVRDVELEEQHKWSAAKVGRSSTKRSRKHRRTTRGKRDLMNESSNVKSERYAEDEKDGEEQDTAPVENTKKLDKEIKLLDKSDNEDKTKEVIEDIPNEANHVAEDYVITVPENVEHKISQKKEVIGEEELEEEVINLILDDSEDFKELPTCNEVAQENKKNNITQSIPQAEQVEEEQDSFGCYLKSKEINMEDLGLIPLNDEEEAEEEVKEDIKKISTDPTKHLESEEMPSLIVCDEEDENKSDYKEAQDEKQKLNETFDAEDSVLVVLEKATTNSTTSEATTEMEALKMSDDESEIGQGSANKMPRIMLTTAEQHNLTLLSTPKNSASKPYRVSTPYCNKSASKLRKYQNEGDIKMPSEMNSSLTTMAPREIVLRGIRKRSLSVCLGAGERLTRSTKKKRIPPMGPTVPKVVNFYSPANQTAIIEDLDKIIAKSVKKNENKAPEINRNKNVTKRRKRSFSFDESMMNKSLSISKLPRPISNQTSFLNATTSSSLLSSSSSSSITKRTKLPNFAAIHQKQFQKMENLVEHVARKQERSKVLINSATKIRPASAQKNISVNVNNKNTLNCEKPKALKRIETTTQAQGQIKKKSANNLIGGGTPKKIAPIPNKTTDDTNLEVSKLPDPRNKRLIIKPKQQQTLPKKHLKPTQSFNISFMSNSMANNSAPKQKPAFNLSTRIVGSSTVTKPSSSANNASVIENNKSASTQDKMASRLQRHMDLFKGRVPASRAGVASRKNEASLRGVRSNRRFELQMQHRRNLEN